MKVTVHELAPPPLEELVETLESALKDNFSSASVAVTQCPDLRQSPFNLAGSGLSGNESVADVGGQPNLFPTPNFSAKYSLLELAQGMKMSSTRGFLVGAGAGPWQDLSYNCELAANLSWDSHEDGTRNVNNQSHYCHVKGDKSVGCSPSPTTNCALMINLYGSTGDTGPVLKVTARSRTGRENFTDCLRKALHAKYGDERPISLGGAFLIKSGKAKFHVMPDFPAKSELPFQSPAQLNEWLTYHDFKAPIVCLTVMHSADPGKKLGLRMEHTHCFAPDGGNRGGHYHYDIQDGGEDIEYEAYLNAAKVIYRIDQPETTLERDLHD